MTHDDMVARARLLYKFKGFKAADARAACKPMSYDAQTLYREAMAGSAVHMRWLIYLEELNVTYGTMTAFDWNKYKGGYNEQ